ncbi:MAG TPA: lysozyme inhibitor LprI family protein [Allosphingosinicella sp.]|nr:lysozyme inhibitor LprI family protein [Allosphingosinicella sp.]
MKLISAVVAGVLMGMSSSASTQDTRDAELNAADDVLDDAYRALLAQLPPHERPALRASQRAWQRWRTLDCKFGWGDRRNCLITRADEREKQLRESVYWTSQGERIRLPDPSPER